MIKLVGDIIGADSLAVIKKFHEHAWTVSGNIGGIDSLAQIEKINENEWSIKGNIGGYDSSGIFNKIREDSWSLKGDIGGFTSEAEIIKNEQGTWQLKGNIGGFTSSAEILVPENLEQKAHENYNSKVSPCFDFSMSEDKENARQEAIIIYQGEESDRFRKSGRLYDRSEHLDMLQNRSEFHRSVQNHIFERYLTRCNRGLKDDDMLNVSSIGNCVLPVAKVDVTQESLAELAEIPEVLGVMPNQEVRLIKPVGTNSPPEEPAEKEIKTTWGLKSLEISKLWEKTKGKDIKVGVIDSGVYGDHPALKGRVKGFIFFDPIKRKIESAQSFDGGSHGTHVCGTIAGGKDYLGISIGVAPEAKLYVANISILSTLNEFIEALSWCINEGANIVNMSIGFKHYDSNFEFLYKDLIAKYDVIPVISAGNSGCGNSSYPANMENSFSVGAYGKNIFGKEDIAHFSGGSSLLLPGKSLNDMIIKPDVVAPGVKVYSSVPFSEGSAKKSQFAYNQGTSMAAPHVSGVAALLMSAYPNARVKEIMEVLKQTATHPDGPDKRPDNRWGYGMINPVAAFNALSGV